MKFNLTTPKAILISSLIITLVITLKTENRLSFVPEAKAEVAGMGYRDLRRDRDFKKAVKYIVENCTVNGYVEDGYLYNSQISC